MITCFSRISGLKKIWNSLTLIDKINLWFGSNSELDTHPPYFEIHHKVAFWY